MHAMHRPTIRIKHKRSSRPEHVDVVLADLPSAWNAVPHLDPLIVSPREQSWKRILIPGIEAVLWEMSPPSRCCVVDDFKDGDGPNESRPIVGIIIGLEIGHLEPDSPLDQKA